MTNLRRLTTLLGLATTFAALSNASVIAYQVTFGPGTTEVTYSLVLPKFDPILGVLNSVTMYFYAAETSSNFTIQNNSPQAQNFDLSVTSNIVRNFANSATAADIYTGETVQLFDTGDGLGLGNCSANNATTVLPANGCSSLTLGPNASVQYAPFTIQNIDSVYGLPIGTGVLGVVGVVKVGTNIANYMGAASTFTLSGVTKIGITFSGGGGNQTLAQATTAIFTAEVDYDYSVAPAPEPATMLLFGTALIGLGVIGRKRLRRS